ncbi:MAG: hypothetical protein K8L99_18395, partial [Anaerolineae bacterium]|nr:hypothetical protein [Anaerolineae bacterium]
DHVTFVIRLRVRGSVPDKTVIPMKTLEYPQVFATILRCTVTPFLIEQLENLHKHPSHFK